MKNYELLDMVGDVNEEYVQAADGNVIRPRFRWKTLAACAACAALALAAYPAYQAANPPLHDYVVMEGAGVDETLKTDLDEAAKAPAQGGPAADSAPEATMEVNGFAGGCEAGVASIYNERGEETMAPDIEGNFDRAPAQDAPAQEAADQYDRLLRGMGMHGEGASAYPEWFAGAWIDQSQLTVAIVDGFHTQLLEAEIMDWCGSGVAFRSAKYSHNFLDGLTEPVAVLLDGSGLNCGIGVDVRENCLGVDLYSGGAAVPDDILEKLAQLDPDGDAIRVRVFTGTISAYDGTAIKSPASADSKAIATPGAGSNQPAAEPSTAPGGVTPATTADDSAKVYHGEDVPADAVPGGAYVGELPQAKEEGRQAHYDLLPAGE